MDAMDGEQDFSRGCAIDKLVEGQPEERVGTALAERGR